MGKVVRFEVGKRPITSRVQSERFNIEFSPGTDSCYFSHSQEKKKIRNNFVPTFSLIQNQRGVLFEFELVTVQSPLGNSKVRMVKNVH